MQAYSVILYLHVFFLLLPSVFNFANANISWFQLNIQFVKLIHVYKICNIICNENFPFDQFVQISSFNGLYYKYATYNILYLYFIFRFNFDKSIFF